MVIPEIKSLMSLEVARPDLPSDPEDCAIRLDARIGAMGGDAGDVFSFTAVTPSKLVGESLPCWGKGLLVVNEFSWPVVDKALGRLLAHASRPTWAECANVLSKSLDWEFENYQPFSSNSPFDTDATRRST